MTQKQMEKLFYEQAEPRQLVDALLKFERSIQKRITGHIGVVFCGEDHKPLHEGSSWKWVKDFSFDTSKDNFQPHIVAIVA